VKKPPTPRKSTPAQLPEIHYVSGDGLTYCNHHHIVENPTRPVDLALTSQYCWHSIASPRHGKPVVVGMPVLNLDTQE
jgi:hypothetical protein